MTTHSYARFTLRAIYCALTFVAAALHTRADDTVLTAGTYVQVPHAIICSDYARAVHLSDAFRHSLDRGLTMYAINNGRQRRERDTSIVARYMPAAITFRPDTCLYVPSIAGVLEKDYVIGEASTPVMVLSEKSTVFDYRYVISVPPEVSEIDPDNPFLAREPDPDIENGNKKNPPLKSGGILFGPSASRVPEIANVALVLIVTLPPA